MSIAMENVKNIIVNTGNILGLNDITKNPGQNPTEELTEAVKSTLSDKQTNNVEAEQTSIITRKNDDLICKISKYDFQDLKIGIKLFLNTDKPEHLEEALNKTFLALNVDSVNNVIISFTHKSSQEEQIKMIQNVWPSLEGFISTNKVQQIGLSDIEESAFRTIYEWATIKPSIIQINLATCCVVPPTLQQFCKDHEILLLTHSDPSDILPAQSISEIFGASLNLKWVVRFLVHIKFRGVLTTKGYIISMTQ